MPSFETPADIFTRLSVFDTPKGSSNTLKSHKNIRLYLKSRYLIIYNYHIRYLLYSITSQNFGVHSGNNDHLIKLLNAVTSVIQKQY